MQVLLEQTWTVSTEKLQYYIQYNIITKKDAIDKLDQTCLGLTNFFQTDNFRVKTSGKQSTKTMKICHVALLVSAIELQGDRTTKGWTVLKTDHLKVSNNMVIAAISPYSNSCAL